MLALGSGISVRSFSRLSHYASRGEGLSVVCSTALGSSLSMRAFVRLGSTLSVQGELIATKIEFGTAPVGVNHIISEGGGISFYTQNTASPTSTTDKRRVLQFKSSDGQSRFWGTGSYDWESEASITTSSDLRMKKNVRPLLDLLTELRE